MNQQVTTSTAMTAKITPMPSWKKPVHKMPSAIQKVQRKPKLCTLRIIAEPRITMAVSARPTMPENRGVRPENSK
ncbi:hypothetical protein D3C81_1871960 [compost metagenome]